MAQLIKQGAEGRIYAHLTLDLLPSISKRRFSKAYRHPDLDAKLTLARLLQEARALHKARHLCRVRTPRVYFVDKQSMTLTMEAIDAPTAKDWILHHEAQGPAALPAIRHVCDLLGRAIARLHAQNLIHGDLTTSNVLVQSKRTAARVAARAPLIPAPEVHARRVSATPFLLTGGSEIPGLAHDGDDDGAAAANGDASVKDWDIIMIDFGLASTSTLTEDKAVDLYVLERAIRSTHPKLETFVLDAILQGYLDEADKEAGAAVMAKLEEVRLRGRKRSMIG